MTAPMNGLPPHTAKHGDHAHRRGFGALFAGRGDQTVRFDRRDTDRMSVVGRDGGARTEATDGEHEADALRHVVFVGNPNVGKSSLFNTLLGARTKVMNAPGTTVLLETGRLHYRGPDGNGPAEVWDCTDTPGTYSLLPLSPDEKVAADAVMGAEGLPRPDLVVAVLDATNIARSLYFRADDE